MPTPNGAPSVVDVLARQLLTLRASVDALLETVSVLQHGEAQRMASATAKAGEEEDGPKMPPVFGARAAPAVDAPELPPIPAALSSSLTPPSGTPNA